ncbi:hypothetical protein V3C33_06995 [Micrococcaceae bacterium Sec5.7]
MAYARDCGLCIAKTEEPEYDDGEAPAQGASPSWPVRRVAEAGT